MTKNKFLKELDKSLYVLAEAERKDIINEYRDIIEEKIKHGKTEKEAVSEFGSIDELSREILSAYKVNPDYQQKDDEFAESARKLGNDFDSFVKKGAKKATDFTKEVVADMKENNHDITIEFVFEILFRAIATLIIMFIASIPFNIVRYIGVSVIDIVISPFDSILNFFWNLFIGVLFIACCFAIFIAMFKQYFRKEPEQVKEKDSNDKKGESTKEEKKEDVESKKVSKEKKKQKDSKNGHPLLDIFLAIAKLAMLCMMIPLLMFNLGVFISIFIVIYMMIKGIMIPGVLLGLIGLFIFFGYLQHLLFSIIFHGNKKIHFYPFGVGIVIGIIGGILIFEQFINLNYHDVAPNHDFNMTEQTYKFQIPTDVNRVFLYNYSGNWNYDVVIDPSLPDGEIQFILAYNKDLVEASIQNTDPYTAYDDEDENTITGKEQNFHVHYEHQNILSDGMKEFRKLLIQNFNDQEIYNYEKLYDVQITIVVNEKTRSKLNI